jgi:hypothetical protein
MSKMAKRQHFRWQIERCYLERSPQRRSELRGQRELGKAALDALCRKGSMTVDQLTAVTGAPENALRNALAPYVVARELECPKWGEYRYIGSRRG